MKVTVKKLISILLVGIMLFGAMSTVSFAEERWETISDNDFENSLGDFSGALGSRGTEGYVNFYHDGSKGTEINFGYGANLTSYENVRISFRAKINSFSTGPATFTGGADQATLGMKINLGGARILLSAEDGYLGGCSSNAAWSSKVEADVGNEWHDYEVLIDASANTYKFVFDGNTLIESGVQIGGNRGYGIYFFSTADASNPVDIDLEYVNVESIDTDGNVLDAISKNDFNSSTGDFSGSLGTLKTAYNGTARLYNNSTEISFGNGLDISTCDKVKISFSAKVNSFTTGPNAFTGGEDKASLAMKINFGGARVIWTAEEDYIGACATSATWAKKIDADIGYVWHDYDIIIDFTTKTYEILLDGEKVYSAGVQVGGSRGYGVNFFSIASEEAPFDAFVDDLSISYFIPEGVPSWTGEAAITYTNTYDSFTVSWPAAEDATSYKVSVDGRVVATVDATSYTYAVDPDTRSSTGYDVSIVAIGEGGESPTTLTTHCNSKYDPTSDQLDIKTVLAGTAGGGADSAYYIYRIPGMVITEKDTLLMYFEARTSSSDNGSMDLIMLRSTDGGETFEAPYILGEGTDTGVTMNNATMIVEGETIHLLYCVNYGVCNTCVDSAKASCEAHGGGGVYYRKSTDDGVSWTTPINISDSAMPDERYLIATGPGAGIVTKDGALICPVWLVLKDSDGANPSNPLQQYPNDICTMYSLDHGTTWQMGEVIEKDRSEIDSAMEAIAVNLSDGRVMYNIRSYSGYRSVAVSDNGYSGFSKMTLDTELIDPGCHAGITSYDGENTPYTLLLTNCENATTGLTGRTNIVLKGSTDDGETWDIRKVIDPGKTGYSTVAVDSKGTIYVLYEVSTGQKENLARISYSAFAPDEVEEPDSVGGSSSITEETQESIDIYGTYVEDEAAKVISVNIKWSETVFTYFEDMRWDDKEHKNVPVEGSGKWSDTPLDITVTNHSNQSVKAELSFRSATVDGERIKAEIKGSFTSDSFVLTGATEQSGATAFTTSFSVTGGEIYADSGTNVSIGSITITIGAQK